MNLKLSKDWKSFASRIRREIKYLIVKNKNIYYINYDPRSKSYEYTYANDLYMFTAKYDDNYTIFDIVTDGISTRIMD